LTILRSTADALSGAPDHCAAPPDASANATATRPPATLPPLAALSVWFGLGTGLLELGLLSARNHVAGWSAFSSLQMSRHFPWMIPLANLLLFLGWGLALGLIGRIWKGMSGRTKLYLLSFPACLAPLLVFPGLYAIAYLTLAAALAKWVCRGIFAVPAQFRRLVAASLPLLALAALLLAGWKGSEIALGEQWAIAALPESEPGRMNVLLLVMDTVRADRLSLYGYPRDTSPNLKRIARQGIRFDQARSTAPWTLPSHASMFTGLWPHETGVSESQPLDQTHPTLAEFLAGRGYLTAGFVANTYFCNSWFGLGRGFAHYEDFHDEDVAISVTEALRTSALGRSAVRLARMPLGGERPRKTAASINDDFLEWLDEQTPKRPFFVFLNYFDAHAPYRVPEGWDRHFGRQAETSEETAILDEWESRPKQDVPERNTTLARDAYDDCLGYLDAQIGKLFDALASRDLLRNTLVIITSDHGEELGEHGLFGHGRSLYGQEVHVPLLIMQPGGPAGWVVTDPVSMRDLPATIVGLLGLAQGAPFPGGSLAGSWSTGSRQHGIASSPAFSEVALRDKVSKNPKRAPAWRGPMQSLAQGGQAFIRNADGRAELYDIVRDPAEEHDLAASADPAALMQFQGAIESLRDDAPAE
jgi:arylsulfatase A-like enzyme